MRQTRSEQCGDSIKCLRCKDTGWYTYEREGYSYSAPCECGKIARESSYNRLKFAALPEAFKGMKLKDFDLDVYSDKGKLTSETALLSTRYYLDNYKQMLKGGRGLYFYSHTKGSGKTRLMVSLANELIELGLRVKYATSMDIISEIKASWDNEHTTENKLIKELTECEVLIIDDFGTERAKDWIQERFYQLINSRYVNKKPTLFTSNYKLDALDYDDRITNRMKERCFQIPFPEESVRDHIASRNMELFITEVKKKYKRGVSND